MDTLPPDESFVLPPPKPGPVPVLYRSKVPSTGLLHFTLIANLVLWAIGTASSFLGGLSHLSSDPHYPGHEYQNPASVDFGYVILCGLGLWWWIHCLSTLRKLRKHADNADWMLQKRG